MSWVDDYVPAMAMFGLQFNYAFIALTSRVALLQGMSPRVFVFYRHVIATSFIAPIAYFSRSKSRRCSLDLRSFSLIFFAALFGVTINQNVYIEGIFLVSSSMATTMANLVPAVTFLMAAIARLESVDIRSLRSLAKIGGTVICVSGAMCMAFLRGPKLLNSENLILNSAFGVEIGGTDNWLLGCFFLFAYCCCWSIWLILQVPISASFPDPVAMSAWMCFFATIQSSVICLLLEPNLEAWKLHSNLELVCFFFSSLSIKNIESIIDDIGNVTSLFMNQGIVGSAIAFAVQSWCIIRRGPVFSALFNPLCTIIVTIFAALFLHEPIYSGSLIGGVAVIIGLYIVLWGKANNQSLKQQSAEKKEELDCESDLGNTSCRVDLNEPLLSKEGLR